ncbi:26S protease regulatory subunit 6A [Artemisia annua]|uniref:26S protease regulatory subunit 6A n=1 Tax=Artemisia annua TaxID=35608 RepID=A0A2U1PFW5_ARTAN|nr:26S protease regulatory subunit 6A [Artemisia annua]
MDLSSLKSGHTHTKATEGPIIWLQISTDVELELLLIQKLLQVFIGDGTKLVHDAFQLDKEKSPVIIFIDEIDAISTMRFDRPELEAACDDFNNVIGSTSFGTVYKGTLSSGLK